MNDFLKQIIANTLKFKMEVYPKLPYNIKTKVNNCKSFTDCLEGNKRFLIIGDEKISITEYL